MPAALHVSALHLYPVKSLHGCAVETAAVDALGLVGDRRFLVIDPTGGFLTQRTLPVMTQIIPRLTPDTLVLTRKGQTEIGVPLHVASGAAELRTVSIWKSEGLLAEDCGDAVAAWLTVALGTPARLVRIGERFHRPVVKATAKPGDVAAFTDAYPFMAISEATLADLNDRLAAIGEARLPMNRFRPSFVIAGATPYAEDTWPRLRAGEITLRAGGPCARCIMTTTDQETGVRAKEPLRLLATYRRDAQDPTRINFGQNLLHETKHGTLRVGDPIEVLA